MVAGKPVRQLLGIASDADAKESITSAALLRTSGEYITQIAEGSNLVDGQPTWEHAAERKDDLAFMLRCCDAELTAMHKAGIVAAPYYFERAAILLRKAKEYKREVELCERYMREVDAYYQRPGAREAADVRKGSRFGSIVARVAKARQLLARDNSAT
jgi:hypothetical protein